MTAHINGKLGDFASTVIMPGEPLRAKFIAENYLLDYQEVTMFATCWDIPVFIPDSVSR